MSAPEEPRDVRLVLSSGAEIVCDLRYDGPDPDGIHQWVAVPRVPVGLSTGMELRAGSIPDGTSITVALILDEPP